MPDTDTMDKLRESITSIVKARFPDSYIRTQVSTLGGPSRPSLAVGFAIGKDREEWPNHIIHNDKGHTSFIVHCKADETGAISKLELDGGIYGYYQNQKSDKAGWRDIKKPTDINGILKNVTKYFDNMKALHDEYLKTLEPVVQAAVIPQSKTMIMNDEQKYFIETYSFQVAMNEKITSKELAARIESNYNMQVPRTALAVRTIKAMNFDIEHTYKGFHIVETNAPAISPKSPPQASEAGFNALFDSFNKILPDNFVKKEPSIKIDDKVVITPDNLKSMMADNRLAKPEVDNYTIGYALAFAKNQTEGIVTHISPTNGKITAEFEGEPFEFKPTHLTSKTALSLTTIPTPILPDASPKPDTTSPAPTHVAYVRISDNHIVGYLSENKLICTNIENALDVTHNTASISDVARDLLKSPHPLDHHGDLKIKLVQYHKDGQYISGVSVPQKDSELAPSPELYKFQIKGYEKTYEGISNPEATINMVGFGTIDSQNHFTGTLKSDESSRDLKDTADYNAKSDPYHAWNYAYNYSNGLIGSTVAVSSLTVTNITLVNDKELALPTYPSLSPTEKQELTDFTSIIKQSYPAANTESLHHLCNIASNMGKLTIQNANGTLSNEKYNSLTDQQEKQIKDIIAKDLPGVVVYVPYHPDKAAISLGISPTFKGTIESSYPVPEIPKNKLDIAQEPKAVPETKVIKR